MFVDRGVDARFSGFVHAQSWRALHSGAGHRIGGMIATLFYKRARGVPF
ncbi:MAG: hypothetical protein V2I56_09670 [Desulfobacteraceae bacterium]|nr:hypothetical protein [Desulfobacteraceae bacterium]